MKRPVFWSRDALDELKKIGRFVARDNPQAARNIAAAIRSAGNKLGERTTGRKGRVNGTYEKTVSDLPYIVVYAVRSLVGGDETVVILRVIHSARDWPPDDWPKAWTTSAFGAAPCAKNATPPRQTHVAALLLLAARVSRA